MLQSIDFAKQNIHFLRLFSKLPPRWRYLRTPFITPYHHLIRITGFAHGTQAYLLTKAGAEHFLLEGKKVEWAIDVFFG
jgi:hypothetical protein